MNPNQTNRAAFFRRTPVRIVAVLVLLFLLYTIAGFWIAPKIIRSQLLKRLPPVTHRQVEVGRIQVNPFRLTLTVSNLALVQADGARSAAVERLHADLQAASLWRKALVLREVEIVNPFLDVRLDPAGQLNWADLVPTNSGATSGPPPVVEIASFRLDGGEVDYRDLQVPGGFERRFGPSHIFFTNVSTRLNARFPGTVDIEGGEGTRLQWAGEVGVNPVVSAGTFEITRLLIPRYAPYVRQAIKGTFPDGAVNITLPYSFVLANPVPDARVTNAAVTLTHLVFTLPDATEPIAALTNFGIAGLSANLQQKRLAVDEVVLKDGRFTAQRTAGGEVDVTEAVSPEFIDQAINAIQQRLEGWQVQFGRILGEHLELGWKDAALSTPAVVAAEVERLEIKGLSNLTNQPVSVNGIGRWAEKGRMNSSVEGTLLPARALAKIDFEHLRLSTFQPYVSELANLDVRQGEVAGQWTIGYNQNPGGPMVTAEGGVAVTDFLAFDTLAGRDFLKWDAMELRQLKGEWAPVKVELDELFLGAPSTSFVLMTNGQFNVLAMLKKAPGAATNDASAAPATPPANSFPLSAQVNRITITNASLLAADQTVPGEFRNTLERFSGSLTNLGWPEWRKTRIELAGFVGPKAPFTVEGWVKPDPAQMFVDLHVTTTNAEVIPFTPYAIKFAGYPIKQGVVAADVKYEVNGQQLQGENKVIVDRLALGPKAGGTPILDLPVKLGIALLKDSDGRITLDIPVKGSLDDPEFGVRKVVWQAVKGLFVKVATSPFKLLGAVFGGSEDEGEALQRVAFEPGATNLTASATNQLRQLVKALEQRPELLLAMRGGASPTNDGPTLARRKLETLVQQLRSESASASGTAAPVEPPSAAEIAQYVPQVFAREFPAAATTSATAAPNDTSSAAPATPPTLSVPEMEQKLFAHWQPSDEELDALRTARVAAVREWLLANGLPADRLASDEPPGETAGPATSDSAASAPAVPAASEPPLLASEVEFSLE